MDRARFTELVEQALDQLPPEFTARLENVEVVVEDQPADELLREMDLDPRHDTLFGLYQGVPLPERGLGYTLALPDKITLYYRPLVQSFRYPDAIRRQIVKTVVHEVGHFFGLDDDEIEDAGY